MDRPLLIWVDYLSRMEDSQLRESCEGIFDVLGCAGDESLEQVIDTHQPAVLCFDFDYPLESQLAVMQSVKRQHTGIPLLMLTVEHSEALAVWSFRARVWNYLVKPVPEQEWRANLQALRRIAGVGLRQRREVRLPGPAVALLGKPNRTAIAYRAVLPAIHYVEHHYGESILAEHMAHLCGMTPFKFSREFRRATGNTFQEHVLRYRVNEACRLLKEEPAKAIADVGSATGFSDSSYFARIFKRYMNVRPSEFAREQVPIREPRHSVRVMSPEFTTPPVAPASSVSGMFRQPRPA